MTDLLRLALLSPLLLTTACDAEPDGAANGIESDDKLVPFDGESLSGEVRDHYTTDDDWDDCMQDCQDDYDAGCLNGGGSCDCGDSSEQCQDDLEFEANNCENGC